MIMELMNGGLTKTTGEIGLDLVWFCIADAGWVKAITRRPDRTWRDYFDDGPSTGYIAHTLSETKR
jgi:hypothetical protein